MSDSAGAAGKSIEELVEQLYLYPSSPRYNERRYKHGALWDEAHAAPGMPTSRDPALVERYLERQRQLGQPDRYDPNYYIVRW